MPQNAIAEILLLETGFINVGISSVSWHLEL